MGWLRKILASAARRRAPVLHIAADVGEGPVVVLVHGIASSAATFTGLIPLLSPKYRCIAIELLGFGGSPAPEGAKYTIEEHVAALHATIISLRLRAPFVLVGHSLGALLAARFAAKHHQSVSRLVLVSPPVYLSPAEIGDPLTRVQVGAYLKVYEFLRLNKQFTIASAARIASFFQLGDVLEVSERNWTPFTLSLENCIESQTTVSDIAAVRVPVDVVYGAQDQLLAPGAMRVVAGLGHVTMHRVLVNDHFVRSRLAKAVAEAIA